MAVQENGRDRFCTYCGAKAEGAKQLYDEDLFKRAGVIRLRSCAICKAAVLDKYVEYDGAIVLIDLLLQRLEAYRHVLLNNLQSAVILKMGLLTVIFSDGYMGWYALPDSGEFFEQEFLFYEMCAKAAIGLLAFIAVCLTASTFRHGHDVSAVGLVLAYSVRFLNLAAFLWEDPWMGLASNLLFGFATVRVIQVTQERSFASSFILCLVALLTFGVIINYDTLIGIPMCV